MDDVSSIQTPSDLLARDNIEVPDWMGIASPQYLENTFLFTIRIWNFLHENNIDSSNYSPKELDDDYREEMNRLADGLGISTMQFSGAASAALTINALGFEEWYTTWTDKDSQPQSPSNEDGLPRRSTLNVTPTLEDPERNEATHVESMTEQNLFQSGVDGTLEWITDVIEYAEENGASDDDAELTALRRVKQELQNGEFNARFVILPDDF